jgi:hypothetical protein
MVNNNDLETSMFYKHRNPTATSVPWLPQSSMPGKFQPGPSQWSDVGHRDMRSGHWELEPNNPWIDSAHEIIAVPLTRVHLSNHIDMHHPGPSQEHGVPFHEMRCKMASLDEVLSTCSSYIDQNYCVSEVNKCPNCSRMRNYLKVLTTEFKSAQTIIKILIEELNVNEHNILAPSVESTISQVCNQMNSVSDCVWTEGWKKKNRLTNLQIKPQDVLTI